MVINNPYHILYGQQTLQIACPKQRRLQCRNQQSINWYNTYLEKSPLAHLIPTKIQYTIKIFHNFYLNISPKLRELIDGVKTDCMKPTAKRCRKSCTSSYDTRPGVMLQKIYYTMEYHKESLNGQPINISHQRIGRIMQDTVFSALAIQC